jgi:hypothetical protein
VRSDPIVVSIPLTSDRPIAGGRYDIGGPPKRSRFHPGAVTLVRNEVSGRWLIDSWTITNPPESLACYEIRLTEAGS